MPLLCPRCSHSCFLTYSHLILQRPIVSYICREWKVPHSLHPPRFAWISEAMISPSQAHSVSSSYLATTTTTHKVVLYAAFIQISLRGAVLKNQPCSYHEKGEMLFWDESLHECPQHDNGCCRVKLFSFH